MRERHVFKCVLEHEGVVDELDFLTESIGIATAAIMQRITRAADPPEPMTDDASNIGRVILAITVERVSSADYITQSA